MRLRLKGALRLMSVENLSTGIEASATGESLKSGDPAVHAAARHRCSEIQKFHIVTFFTVAPRGPGLDIHQYNRRDA